MELHIRDVSKTCPNSVQAPIVILATHIIEDVSELCTRMAIINRREIEPGNLLIDLETGDNIKGVKVER